MTHVKTPLLNIIGLSESELVFMPDDKPFALVSNTSPTCDHVASCSKSHTVLRLKFDDVNNQHGWTYCRR